MMTYCFAQNGATQVSGYFVGFRVADPTGDTLNVVDLTGQVPMNRGKRIDDINTQAEPATITVVPLRIGGGADSLEFWYFGPFANGTAFDIALIDPNNVCDTIFVASGSYSCVDMLNGTSDPFACAPSPVSDDPVPLYFLDFSFTEFDFGGGGGGNEDFDEVFIIMQRTRENACCDLNNSVACFEFIVRLADNDIGLSIDDVGSGSSGGEIYADSLNGFTCTGDVDTTYPFFQDNGQSSDTPLCLPPVTARDFIVLSCKPGGNETSVSIDAISNIFAPPSVTIEPCNTSIEVFGTDTVMWSSPDDPNLDNLNSCDGDSTFCSFLYNINVFGEVTACEGDTFTYIVSGFPDNNQCLADNILLFDTTYVVVYPTFTVEIDTMCNPTGDSLIMSAIVTSPAVGCEYAFNWSTGDTTQTITVAFSDTEYFITVSRGDLAEESQDCIVTIDSVTASAELGISCENIIDSLYTCINELPVADPGLVIIIGCGTGDPLIYIEENNNGGAGCVGDTLIITRYYIVDFDGDTITTTTDQDTCVQLLSFVDDISPVITSGCPADTAVACASEVPAPDTSLLTATDNCEDEVIITHEGDIISNQTCPNDFTITRTYTAMDACGNSATCSQVITVTDSIAPVVTCPANITVQCTDQVPDPDVATVIATDNCGGTPVIIHVGDEIIQGACAERSTITRTYQATDACGNSATCTQSIVVFDETPPVLDCPATITLECTASTQPDSTGMPGISDNCGESPMIVFSDMTIAGACEQEFIINRTWTATDACGNSASCTQVIFIEDNAPPSIICPADITVGCLSEIPDVDTGSATASDSCGVTTIIFVGDSLTIPECPNSFIVTRVYEVTDQCGNSATCSQTITVFDDSPPMITCPDDLTVACAFEVPSADTSDVIAFDNCDASVMKTFVSDVTINQTCEDRFVINRTYQATDMCGNTATCVQTITVFDDILPSITCPSDITVSCATDVMPADTATVIVSDNCEGEVIVTYLGDVTVNETCANRFVINRTYQATDECGNTSTCQQNITVFDDTLPLITCPADITVECASDVPVADITDVMASDNCGGTPVIDHVGDVITNMSCANRFTVIRTYSATDDCGNSGTCVQTITINDTIAPIITCPEDVTIGEGEFMPVIDFGSLSDFALFTAAGAFDNLGSTVVAGDIGTHVGTITGFPPGVVIGQMHAANGITAQAATDVAVAYGQLAAITCGTVLGTTLGNGQVLTPDVYCLGAASTVNMNLILDAQGDPNAVFIFKIDGALSTSTFSNVILINGASSCNVYWQINGAFAAGVNSIFRGNLFIQGAISLNFGAELEGRALSTAGAISTNSNTVNSVTPCSSAEISMATATDNCDSSVVLIYTDEIMGDECCQETVVTRTWVATDDCGNSSSCMQTISVVDTTSVIIICPADVTINNGESTSPDNTGTADATDNCGGEPDVSFNDVTIEGNCPGDFRIERTWTATDACENTSTCLQTIQVTNECNVDLSLVKELNVGQGPVIGGDDVDFTITITNEGALIIGSVTVIDYIPDGFTLNDPDWTGGNLGSTGQSATIVLSIDNGGLDPDGLDPAESVSVEITLQAEPDIAPGIYSNIAEISHVLDTSGNDVTNTDIDSDPDTDDTNDPDVEDDHDAAAICVLSEPVIVGDAFACTGDTVTYSLVSYDSTHTYMWMVDAGGIIIENNDSSIVVYWIAAPGGPYIITVMDISSVDCQSTATLEVFIQGGEPIACFEHINLSIDRECGTIVGSGLILTGESAGDNNYMVFIIDMNGDTVPNATLTFMHVGMTFKVSVVSECSGQSCWGWLTVEDKLPPAIECVCPSGNEEESCEITCLQLDQFLAGNIPSELQPTVLDNCGGTTIEIDNIEFNFETCSGGFIRVTWTATDIAGNTSSCIQQFNIIPLTLDSLVFPVDFTGECTGNSDPSVTGWPQIDGIDLTNIPGSCNIIATYTDMELPLCGGGRKIIRTWSVFDWCVPEIREFVQFILLMDRTGPVLTCPSTLTVGTDVWYCSANVVVPRPLAIDACSDIVNYQLFWEEGVVIPAGNIFRIPAMPLGTNTMLWIVTDECGNTSTCTFDIVVVDNVPPVMSCQAHLVVSLTNDRPNGITLVPADAFNDFSLDNCSPVSFRARRMESCINIDWTTGGACVDDIPGGSPGINSFDRGTSLGICVPFSCCDLGGDPIMIELEATDTFGNVNYCMVEVTVQDKLAPVITCPPDITVSCEFEINAIEGVFRDISGNGNGSLDEDPLSEIFGNMFDAFRYNERIRQPIIINDPGNDLQVQPFNWGIDGWATDNCEVNLEVSVTISEDCSGAGLPGDPPPGAVKLIQRRFIARDASGNLSPGTCVQRIWVVDFDPFFITDTTCTNENIFDDVIWPCDVMLSTCPDELTGTGEPVIFDDACNLIGVAFEDTRFDFADGACYKILREWSIIDWCQFDANTGAGIWSYTQTIKVIDGTGPEFLNCPAAAVELCLDDQGVTLPDNNQVFLGENNPNASSCSVHLALSQSLQELCSESVIYHVRLYPFNGTEFIQLKPATVLLLDDNHEGTMNFDTRQSTMPSVGQNGLPYNSPACGDYHRLVWTVEDGCGNTSACDYLLRLEDCKDPTPVCLNGISTVIMPLEGQVTIWASDFDASSYDDCTSSTDLLFSFSGITYQPSFTYTCDNVPVFGEEIEVEIWVADAGADQNCNGQIEWSERNKAFCITYIIITDNNDVCDQEGLVLEGEVLTEFTDAVTNVSVQIIHPEIIIPQFITSTDGKYIFGDIPAGLDYSIKAGRNDDHRNGVSTLDLVRIQKHLLGKEPFISPLQYIAADANNSSSVSAIDLIEIRKLVLGLYNEFPLNKSWRFVKKGSPMADGHPWPFEESISIDDLTDGMGSGLDFTGIKIGDVNNTVKANAMQILPREARRVVSINTVVQGDINTDNIIEVKLTFPEMISGFQWTFETRDLEFVGIKSSDIRIDESNVGLLQDGLMTMSWNGEPIGENPLKNQLSFVIQFRVLQTGLIQNMMRMTSQVTEAEAYTMEGDIVDIKMSFDNAGLAPEFALYQNRPNPWNGQTLIGFDLPFNGEATLSVFDITGKLVKTITREYKSGYNTVMLKSGELPGPGILYYRLESGEFSATRKMMIIQ